MELSVFKVCKALGCVFTDGMTILYLLCSLINWHFLVLLNAPCFLAPFLIISRLGKLGKVGR